MVLNRRGNLFRAPDQPFQDEMHPRASAKKNIKKKTCFTGSPNPVPKLLEGKEE